MPGVPIDNLSNADALIDQISRAATPSRLLQTSLGDLKRMPLHHIAAANHCNVSSSALPLNRADNQALPQAYLGDGKSLTVIRHPADLFAPQYNPGIHGSADSEHDLAAMVHDFMENGSYGSDIPDSSDGENGLPNCPRLFETLQVLKSSVTSFEKELSSILSTYFPSVEDTDLFCLKSGAECKGDCIRQMLVKHLRCLGYDAAICSSKWSNSGKVPGGEYEFVDVSFRVEDASAERLIVDVDFQSQFEIARPTHSYVSALKFLPIIFVGSEEKLRQVLQVMAEAVKMSLKQNSMPLPPWRTLEYMNAKWMSSFERIVADTHGCTIYTGQGRSQWRGDIRTKQCVEQLRHLKLCIATDVEKNYLPKPSNLDRNRVMYIAKTRCLTTGLATS